jgi:cytoskeletal protein CcmA (bactofilin family)
MIHFPPNPVVGQRVTSPSGSVWVWNGQRWTAPTEDSALMLVPEAPIDGTNYVRQDAVWIHSAIQTDALADGQRWVRQNHKWEAIGTADLTDAPHTGVTYGREDGQWEPVLPLKGGTVDHLNVTHDLEVHGDLDVHGDAELRQKLKVHDETELLDDLVVQGKATVHGDTELMHELKVHSDVTLEQKLHVKDDVEIDGDLSVVGTAWFDGLVEIDDLKVIKDIDAGGGHLTVRDIVAEDITAEDVHVKGDLTVDGETKLEKSLAVEEGIHAKDNISAEGQLIIDGKATLKDELEVDEKAHFKDDVEIDKDLEVKGDAEIHGDLELHGELIGGVRSLSFRPMTPNVRDWIPHNLEGSFVCESPGPNVWSPPQGYATHTVTDWSQPGRWTYFGTCDGHGNITINAISIPSVKHARQTTVRQMVRREPAGWSGWSTPAAPVIYDGRRTGMMSVNKLHGFNRLFAGVGQWPQDLRFGWRGSQGYLNGNMAMPVGRGQISLRHEYLVNRGINPRNHGANWVYYAHPINRIWRLQEALDWGGMGGGLFVRTNDPKNTSGARLGFSGLQRHSEYRGRHRTRHLRFTRPGTARFPFRLWFEINFWIGTAMGGQANNQRASFIVDCRTLGTGARWVHCNGQSDGTDATPMVGMFFSGQPQPSAHNNTRVEFVSSNAMSSNAPAGKVYQIDIEASQFTNMFLIRVHAFEGQSSAHFNWTGAIDT